MKTPLLAALALAASFSSHDCAAANLTVEIRGVAAAKGMLVVAVYDKADTWLRKPLKAARVEPVAGTTLASLDDLPEGTYAISLYHDENGNGRLDANEMRIPIEPWGFSNDAIGMFGPASFEDARFTLTPAGKRIAIQLRS